MTDLKALNVQIGEISDFLEENRYHSLQVTEVASGKKQFSACHRDDDTGVLEGFLFNNNETDDIEYLIDLSDPLKPTLDFNKNTDDPDQDIVRVKAEMLRLQKTARARRAAEEKAKKAKSAGKPSGGGNPDCEGYYLRVGVATGKYFTNFADAVGEGEISEDAAEFCIARNFKLIHYKKKK